MRTLKTPKYFILAVQHIHQKNDSSCAPACICTVLNYFGKNINQRRLWEKGRIKGYTGTFDSKMAPVIIKKGYYFDSYWRGSVESDLPARVKSEYLKSLKPAKKAGWRY